MQGLHKYQAIRKLREGKKVKHKSFVDGEYVYLKDGKILDENNNVLPGFWDYRYGAKWNTGWSVVK